MARAPRIRALAKLRDHSGVEAQLLDIDIAVRGKDIKEVLAEVKYAIIASYQIAVDLGETPFVNLVDLKTLRFHNQWADDASRSVGCIDLPDNVAQALAAVLQRPEPVKQIDIRESVCA